MGQKSTQAKREVDETRAHLGETLDAIQLKARRNLDVRTQLQTNRALQVSTAGMLLGIAALAFLEYRRRSRRSPAERLARKLKLTELRDRINDFGEDARAWATAQKRIVRADTRSKPVESQRRESIARRLIVGAAEAALTALAAGFAKKLVSGAGRPPDQGREAAPKKR